MSECFKMSVILGHQFNRLQRWELEEEMVNGCIGGGEGGLAG